MIFVRISQNFIKSHLKICLISQDFSPQLMACMVREKWNLVREILMLTEGGHPACNG